MLVPKLRWPVEIRLESVGSGQQVLFIQCPNGLSKPLLLVKEIAPVVMAMNGELSTEQILERFSGAGLTQSLLNELLNLLDSHFFLENERYLEAFSKHKQSFAELTVRTAALAGGAYPSDPEELRLLVDKCIGQEPKVRRLCALISPHIDYDRGKVVYGTAYRHFAASQDSTIILIGTSHRPGDTLFQLCRKDFASPLGLLRSDKDFIQELSGLYGQERGFRDEYLHAREHSLELQLPFLAARAPQAKIVPILVGGFHEFLRLGKTPGSAAEYDDFIEALRYAIAKWRAAGREVVFVLGIDLAHVGRQFGDSFDLTPEVAERIRHRDYAYLECLKARDKSALWSHVAEDLDARRICGFPTTYSVLDTLERLGLKYTFEIFDYKQAINPRAGCMVTFAAAGFSY